MARYITDLTELATSIFASGDVVEVWHAAGGSNRSKKLRLDRFATLATANTFADVATFAGSGTGNLCVDMPSRDLFAGTGPWFSAGRNNNASTAAPGGVRFAYPNGSSFAYLYVDNSAVFRYITGGTGAGPTSATFAGGSVVGAQTSSLDAKDLQGDPDVTGLWDRIGQGADAVRRFTYKSGAFNNEEFSGVVVDYAPHYGMDRDGSHPAGKSLNEINILGDLLLAVSQLGARVAALEAK